MGSPTSWRVGKVEADPRPAVPAADDIERSARVLSWILTRLDEEERHRFGLELLDAARAGDPGGLVDTLNAWLLTVVSRAHPDFDRQTEEHERLRSSGELLKGIDLGEFGGRKAQ